MKTNVFMAKGPQMESPPPLDASAQSNRARILYAEDEPMIRGCTCKYLSRAGYEVTAVENGEQAWEALQSSPYDLLITDQQMPGLSGKELIAKIQGLGMTLPVIVAASDLEFLNDSGSWPLPIAAALRKPFPLGDLSHAVGQALCAGHNVRWEPISTCLPIS
jgi:CheY-like chemotaxis protein